VLLRILSVDLAHSSYNKLGVVLLEDSGDGFSVRAITPGDVGLTGEPSAHALATNLVAVCRRLSVSILLLDGPQGWKDPDNGLKHSRVCERELNTPGKTGLPGNAKPGNYLPFIAFSVSVFDGLVAQGFELWSGRAAPLLAIESFPWSAWRQLGIVPLGAKSKARREDLERVVAELQGLFPLRVPDRLSHDQVQALVAALAGVAVSRGSCAGYVAAGVQPKRLDGSWREGFIINPTREALGSCA